MTMDQVTTKFHQTDEYSIINENELYNSGMLSRSPSLCVLLVEDDEADAYLIKYALDSNARVGEVIHATDGVEALELIESGAASPDLAIVDLHMPRKNGFSLLSDFAAMDRVQFPSVVLTSSRSGADALRSRKRGADVFMTKPNTLAKLTYALDNIISNI